MNLTPFLLATLLLAFPLVAAASDANAPASAAAPATVDLLVYKKWIGASGNEAKVEIRLDCGGGEDFEPRFINRDRPDGWQIGHVPEDGIFCSVREIGRDTFVADAEDCRELLVIPGQEVECTMVNTKVVKRIDMLNRYGMGLMIAVMLVAGLVGVRKFT